VQASAYTTVVGSITDAAVAEEAMHSVDAVLHPATLHKPHVVTRSRRIVLRTSRSFPDEDYDEHIRGAYVDGEGYHAGQLAQSIPNK